MRRVIIALVLLISSLSLLAQESHSREPLLFEQAMEMMLSDNPQISANEHQVRAAQQERRAAIGLRMPQIGISANYVYMGDDIGVDLNNIKGGAKNLFDGVANGLGGQGIVLPPAVIGAADALFKRDWGINIQDRDFAMIAGTVKVPIYMGGKINAANRAARINEQVARTQGTQSVNALISELVERYYGLKLAHSVVQIQEQVLEAMRLHLRDAIELEKNGVIARSERLYMDVKVAEAERDLLAAQLQHRTLESALRSTLSTDRNFHAMSDMFVMSYIAELSHFQELAISNNPQLRQVGLQRDLAQQGVVATRSDLLPHITAMGGYNLYDYQVSKAMPKWIVGAGVSFNIFNGLNKEFKLSAARSKVRQVESLEQKASSDILMLIETLYAEMKNYADRIPSINTSLEFAQEYLRAKRTAFNEGVSSAVDVVDAELNLAGTRVEKLQTAYYYDLMLARLLEASGVSEEFATYQGSSQAVPIVVLH